MVDLVKIRKKAKEKKDAEAAAAVEQEASAPPPKAEPVQASEPLERPQPALSGAEGSSAGVAPQAPVVSAGPTSPPAHPKSAAEDSGAPKAEPTAPSSPASPFAPPTTSKLQKFLETAGQKRAVQARKEVEAAGEQMEVLTFTIAGENYAIAIEGVVIITPRPITRIPNADPSIVGILSLRGTIIVIVDARARLQHPPAGEPDLDTRIVVVERNGESAGFFVDRVARVIKVATSDVQAHPVAHASEQQETIRGVFRHGEALTILLDLDKLLERGVAASVP